jgi:hypothetical protein
MISNNDFQNTQEFWENFHESLNSPISYWRDYKNLTIIEWFKSCSAGEMRSYLNIIFENAPVAKGEYPVVYGSNSGMILTNFRLFINLESGLYIIPLTNLLSYEVFDGKKTVITYNLNGNKETLTVYSWLLKEYIDSTVKAKQWLNLKQEVIDILQYGFFDLKNKFNLIPHRVKFELNGIAIKDDKNSNSKKNKKDFFSPESEVNITNLAQFNIFKQISYFLINAPHWLLLLITPWLGYWTYIGSCCCVNQSEGFKIKKEGLDYFTNTDNLFYIITVILPFLLGAILAIRMIFSMLFNIRYPNGDSPYGFLPLFYLALFIGMSYLYLNSLFMFTF